MRFVQVTVTNETRGYTIDQDVYPLDGSTPWGGEDATLGDLFRQAQREGAGQCKSRVYRDICTPQAEPIGYFFISRQPCDSDDGSTYIRGVWVVVAEGKRRPVRPRPASEGSP